MTVVRFRLSFVNELHKIHLNIETSLLRVIGENTSL